MLAQAEPFLHRNVHPTVIVAAYAKALQAALKVCEGIAKPVDIQDKYVGKRGGGVDCVCGLVDGL